jgi:hypothetical protein
VDPEADTIQCIGVQYAFMHLTATLGTASVLMNWEHERTKDSDEIQVVAAYVTPFPSCARHVEAEQRFNLQRLADKQYLPQGRLAAKVFCSCSSRLSWMRYADRAWLA